MARRRNPLSIILLTLTLVGAGCSPARSPATASTEAKASTATEKDPSKSLMGAAKVQESAADSTLSTDEYEDFGVPSIQKLWTVTDYKAAIKALTAMFNENPAGLPRSASKHSGAVFRRLVARENLALYANPDVPWSIRNLSVVDLNENIALVSQLYLQSFNNGVRVERELLELAVYQAHCSILMWATVDEVAGAIYQKNAGYAARMGGLDEMNVGTARSLGGMVTMLSDRESVQVPDMLWYTQELIPIVPNLLGRLKPSQQAELRQRIDGLAASERQPELAKQLKALSRAAAHPMAQVLPQPSNMSDAP